MLRIMIKKTTFYGLFLLFMDGVFGDADAVKSVSVTEGDSVTLNSDVTEVQRDDQILWMFGPRETRIAEIYKHRIDMFSSNVTFGDRLHLDSQNGSLTIRNIRTEHTGLYKRQIRSDRGNTDKTFSVTVYAPLPNPVVSSSNCSSSSSSSSSCSLACSAVNVSHVTLSWYKGNSLLSSISVSDLSISLSLPLEIQCLDDSYSCVVSYSFTNRTTHLNITDLCHACPGASPNIFLTVLIIVVLLVAVITGLVLMYCYGKRAKQTSEEARTTEEEVNYADVTLTRHRASDTETDGRDQTEYSRVALR